MLGRKRHKIIKEHKSGAKHVYFTAETIRTIDILANKNGISRSELIAKAVRHYADQ